MRKFCSNCENHKNDVTDACLHCTISASRPTPSRWTPGENYVPDTNAQQIQGWIRGELKDFILAVSLGHAPWCDHHCANKGDDGCDKCIEKWLQQPAKEETK